jgi:hypothetical protein
LILEIWLSAHCADLKCEQAFRLFIIFDSNWPNESKTGDKGNLGILRIALRDFQKILL